MNWKKIIKSEIKKLYFAIQRRRFSRIHGLTLGRGVQIIGTPIIDVRNGGSIVVEDFVTLNSRNQGYHINMHSPVKLFADKPGAVIRIGAESRIHGSCLHAFAGITVGRRCLIAANCQIIDSSGHDVCLENPDERLNTQGNARPIVIEDAVWIGANSIILPGVHIGRGSVVAAGSVVTREVPPLTVVGGNPARVLRTINHETVVHQ